MKLNKKLIYALGLLALISTASCKKYLDINTNPYTATKVDPKLLFGYAVTAWDLNKNSGDLYIPVGLMSQSIASGGDFGFEKSNVYDISPYALGNTWKVYYSTAGNNLKTAIRLAEESEPVQNNAAAQCKIVLAQLAFEATTLYGDVPFTEAWDPEKFPYPKYDKQEDVFNSVLKLLDEAMAQMDPASTLAIKDYDVFYKGDIQKWTKLANSIKLKVLMTMVDKAPAKASDIAALLAKPEALMSSAADTWRYPYYNTTDMENPKFRLLKKYTNSENQWFFANKTVFDFMEEKDDPRIPAYFNKGNKGTYKAIETEHLADASYSVIGDYFFKANTPSVIMSYHEVLFYQSEAYARGLGVAKDLSKAQQLYKSAITAAMSFYKVDEAAMNDYVENRMSDLTTVADPVREIHIQQWIDYMDRPIDAFLQWRRSGPEGQEVPALKLPLDATTGPLIRRFTLSPEELATNPNIPKPQPTYHDKMWFDL